MKDIDDAITKALEDEVDQALYDFTRRETLFGQVRDMMFGTSLQVTALAYVIIFMWMGLAIWFGIRFFNAPDTQSALAWGLGFLLAFFAIGMLKIWFWMLAMRNTVLREIKRLELQVAKLGEPHSKA